MTTGPDGALFVGRGDLLKALLRDVAADRPLRVDRLSGSLGMGKSSVLYRLSQEGAASFDVHVIDMETYDPNFPGLRGDAISYGAMCGNYACLKRLVRDVMAALDPADLGALNEEIDAAWVRVLDVDGGPAPFTVHQHMKVGKEAEVTDSSMTVNVHEGHPLARLTLAIRVAAMTVLKACLDRVQEIARRRPVMFLIDNFDLVADEEIGDWLREGLQGLSNAVIVLTHLPGARIPLPSGLGDAVALPPLSVEEVEEYLRLRLGPDAANRPAASLIHEFANGSPGVVALVCDLVLEPGSEVTLDHLREGLRRLANDPQGRLTLLVEEMIERLPDKRLAKALQAASVLRRVEAPALEALLSGEFGDTLDTPRLLTALESFTFTSFVESGHGRRGPLRVAPFIARGIADRMQQVDPGGYGEFHARAAGFYFSDFTSEDCGYGDWFHYEDPVEQQRLHDWLYHLAHTGDVRSAVKQLAFVFLDAFWWWGNYVRFDFCEEIAADVRQLASEYAADSAPGQTFGVLANALRELLDKYPTRSKNHVDFEFADYPAADWEAVRLALLRIRDLCRLRRRSKAWDAQSVHLAALLDIFIAHTYRYRSGMEEKAVQSYGRALDAFSDDTWNSAWVTYELADLNLERGRVEEALEGSVAAASLLDRLVDEEELDEELTANLHRLRADCFWHTGRWEAAAREYGLAVVHAYRFHPVGGPPDEYTMTFYLDQRWRAVEMLTRLWGSERRDDAVRAGLTMQAAVPATTVHSPAGPAEVAELLEAGVLVRLALALFPRGPEFEELHKKESPFMDEWLVVDEALGEEPVEDLRGDPRALLRG